MQQADEYEFSISEIWMIIIPVSHAKDSNKVGLRNMCRQNVMQDK